MALHLLFGLAVSACFPATGDRILMRDLTAAIPAFAVADAEQIIGFAPAPGAQRRFSAGEISRLAGSNEIAIDAAGVCFERKLTPLTKEQVMTALRASLPQAAELEPLELSHAPTPAATPQYSRSRSPPAPHDPAREPA